jgi:hypothetical protein
MKKKRDQRIENDKNFALDLLQEITWQINKENKSLSLLTYYNESSDLPEKIATNYYGDCL